MKRIIALSAALMMLLAGCGNKAKEQTSSSDGSEWRLVSTYDMYEKEKHGCFIIDTTGRLDFLDFETMENTPLCNNAACKHEPPKGAESEWNENICPAYGKNNHPFLYEDKLYYFKSSDFEQRDDGLLSQGIQLWKCDIGGGNEKQLAEIKGLTIQSYNKCLLTECKLWALLNNEAIDPDNVTRPAHHELVCFDLKTGEYKNYGAVSQDHYSAGSYIFGVWEGKLIFQCSYSKDDRPFTEGLHEYAQKHALTDTEAMGEYTATIEFINSYFEADLSSGEVAVLDKPEPLLITEKGYYYIDNGRLKCLKKDGKTLDLAAIDNVDIQYLGGGLFYRNGEKSFLLNEDTYEQTQIAVGDNTPLWVYSDELIYMQTRDIIDEQTGMVIDTVTEYIKKPISELLE